MTQMTNNFCSPPKKRAKSEHAGTSKNEDYPDSDDSFNDPVLPEPSQITQTILQRRDAKYQNVGTQQQPRENGVTRSVPVHSSPLRAPPNDGRRKPMQRTVTSVTPRRFNTQERNDYHQNGQLLMLKNRVENMERERERLAAQTRDQLIAKEKHHATEISEKEERIRQLEVQIQCLRQENLQNSFQIHNVTMSGTVDIEMAGSSTTPGANTVLPTKRVSLPRSDVAWKNISRFGAAASVFANNSTIHGFGTENGSETFAHIPSQMLGVPNESSRCPQPVHMVQPLIKQVATITKSEQCQADGLSSEWNVRRTMRESSVEFLLKSATACEDSNFDLCLLRRLCLIRDHLDLKCHLGVIEQVDDDF